MAETIIKDDKPALGLLIGYYSNFFLDETKSFALTNSEFIKNNEINENICSIQTFINLKKGLIIKNDEIYYDFMDKLHHQFSFFTYAFEEQVRDIVNQSSKKLKVNVEKYYRSKIYENCNAMIQLLSQYDTVLEYEYREAFQDIVNYYRNGTLFSPELITKYSTLIDVYNEDLRQIIKHLIFVSKYRSSKDDFSLTNLFYSLKMDQETMFNLRYDHCFILIMENNQIDALSVCNDLEKTCHKTNNVDGLLSVYQCKMLIMNNIQKSEVPKLQKQIDDLVIDNIDNLDSTTVASFYYNKAIIAYKNKEYSKALEYFSNVIIYKPEDIMPCAIYACHISNRLKKTFKENFIVPMQSVNFSNEVEKVLYEYYQMQYHGAELEVLRNFLLQHYRMIRKSNSKFYIDILDFELRDNLGISLKMIKRLEI